MKTIERNTPISSAARGWVAAAAMVFGVVAGAPAQIPLTVNVGTTVAQARPELYSLNFQNALDPAVAGNAAYKQRVDELQPRLVRYHAYEQIVQGNALSWIDFGARTWNRPEIDQVLRHKPGSATDVLITITGWPSWMDANNDNKLDANQKAAYAAFCADLVNAVNTQLGHRVKYWEPFNEKDGDYRGAADMAELADIFRRCATAMKAQDPSIKLVGGAWRQPWDPDIDAFLTNLGGQHLDVWSHHNYGGGGSADPVQIYNSAHLESGVANVRNKLNQRGFGAVPVWLDEWNMFWSWDAPGYANMTNHVGAVYDALVFKYLAEQGIADAAFAWNAADGRYGKIKGDFTGLNPGGQLLKLLRQHAVGAVLGTASGNAAKVEVLAVRGTATVAAVLINQSQVAEAVSLTAPNWNPAADAVAKKEISAAGYAETTVSWAQTIRGRALSLPANSVTVLLLPNAALAAAAATPSAAALNVYPNPGAADAFVVRYELARPAAVRLELLDALGRRVALLHDGAQAAGLQRVQYAGPALPLGSYFCRLRTDATAETRPLRVQ